MPKPILVGYDPVQEDCSPVEFGLATARITGAPLMIAAVYADATIGGGRGRGTVTEDLLADADVALEHLRRTVSTDGLEVELWPLGGHSAPAALHHAAEAFDAGLLVVGSGSLHRTGGVGGTGSTAERLMHGAPCPIAVVPHGCQDGGGTRTIGVGYVDTPEGRDAVRGAMALARRAGARLRLLSAVPLRHCGRGADEGALRVIGDSQGTEVEIDVSAQEPTAFLVAASELVDMLVCGSRGYGPRRAVLMGGVSRELVRRARCPVIVLARGSERQLESLIGASAGATAL